MLKLIDIPDYISRIKIDVGLSYNAPVSQKLLEHDKDVFVFGFEPNPESVKCIHEKNCDFGSPIRLDKKYIEEKRIQILQFALDDVNDIIYKNFFIADNDPGCSSLHESISPLIITNKTIKVPTISLNYFFEKFNWVRFPYIEWLKIDAQGSDLNIIKSAKKYLNNIVYITAEANHNQYKNCEHCNEKEIDSYMHQHNFSRIYYNSSVCDPTYINNRFIQLKNSIYLWQQD